MNAKNLAAAGLLAILAAACGGSDDPPAPATVTLSCNVPAEAYCLAATGTPTAADTSAFNAECATAGGTAGSGCPTANRVGRCRMPGTNPEQVYSFYAPIVAADAEAFCLEPPAGVWTPN